MAGGLTDRWDCIRLVATLLLRSIYLGSDELIAFAVDIDDFDRRVILEVLAELGDVHVHRAGVEIVIVNPYGLEREVAFEYFVDVCTQQAQKFAFLCGKLGDFVIDHKHLLLCVECELADFVHRDFLAFLAFDTAQYGFDAEHQFFHGEWFGDVVVGTDFEAFEYVVFERLGGEEYDGDFGVDRTDFLCESESVLFGIITSRTHRSYLPFRNAL